MQHYKVKGDFHFHSLHSGCQGQHGVGQLVEYEKMCGQGAVREMIEASKLFAGLGYEYLAVTNHVVDPILGKAASKVEIDFLLEHIKQIKTLKENNQCEIEILAGVEVDILNHKGGLSVPGEALKKLDVVIASNHRFAKDNNGSDIKDGFLGAIKNKDVDIIGHLDRYIKNLSIDDWKEIIENCEKYKKIIEFNLRAPFSRKILKMVAESEVLLSIGSDTHPKVIKQEFNFVEEYVEIYFKKAVSAIDYLQKNGISPARVINTWNLVKLRSLGFSG